MVYFETSLLSDTVNYTFNLTVSDGDLSYQEFFEVTVNQVNDAPVITSVAPSSATEDIIYEYQLDIEDKKGVFEFQFQVYNQKTDQKGNKVIREKTKDKRTTHWVPSVQTDDFINSNETNNTEIDD